MKLPDPNRSRAVLIGVSNHSDKRLERYEALAKGVRSLADLLRNGSMWGLPESNCLQLVNDDATQGNIKSALAWASKEAEEAILVYYGGHGILLDGELYLHSSEQLLETPEDWLPYSNLRRKLARSRCRARRRVLLIDACYSGRAIEQGALGEPLQEEWQAEDRGDMSVLMTASTAKQKSRISPDGEYTRFMSALLMTLRSGNSSAGAFLTADDVYGGICKEIDLSVQQPMNLCANGQGSFPLFGNRAAVANEGAGLSAGSGERTYPSLRDYWHPDTTGAGFVGRESELARLEDALRNLDRSGRIQSLGGIGGVGKTELAVAYAQRNIHRFPDGRILYDFQSYSNSRSPESADQALIKILPTICVDLPAQHVEQLGPTGRLATWQAYTAERKLLVIWDNVKSMEQVAPLLLRQDGCATIVTSCDSIDIDSSGAPIWLEPLSQQDAVLLFEQIAGDGQAADLVESLVKADMYVPVLIQAHARFVRSGKRSLTELIAELPRRPRNPEPHIQQALFDRLDGSFYHLNRDQQYALCTFGAHPGQFVILETLATLLGCDVGEANRLMDGLVSVGLVQRYFHQLPYTDQGLRAYTAHDLVFAWAAHHASLTDDLEPTLDSLVTYYLEKLREYRPRRLPWLRVEAENIRDTALARESLNHANLASAIGYRCYRLDRYSDAAVAFRHALGIFDKVDDLRGSGFARLGLGRVARAQGDMQLAAEFYNSSARLSQSAQDRSGFARSQRGLGHLALAEGDTAAAFKYHQTAAEIFDEVGDRSGSADARLGLADVAHAQGDMRAAAAYFQRAAEISDEIGNQFSSARACLGLGDTSQALGNLDAAVVYFQRAAEISDEVGNQFSSARARLGLGEAALADGSPDKAESYFRIAMDLFESIGLTEYAGRARSMLGRINELKDA